MSVHDPQAWDRPAPGHAGFKLPSWRWLAEAMWAIEHSFGRARADARPEEDTRVRIFVILSLFSAVFVCLAIGAANAALLPQRIASLHGVARFERDTHHVPASQNDVTCRRVNYIDKPLSAINVTDYAIDRRWHRDMPTMRLGRQNKVFADQHLALADAPGSVYTCSQYLLELAVDHRVVTRARVFDTNFLAVLINSTIAICAGMMRL
jgi:hypothetical protein